MPATAERPATDISQAVERLHGQPGTLRLAGILGVAQMALHEGEKFRCEDCNAQVAVIRSSDTRSLELEATEPSVTGTLDQLRLVCCGKAMVRFCIKAA